MINDIQVQLNPSIWDTVVKHKYSALRTCQEAANADSEVNQAFYALLDGKCSREDIADFFALAAVGLKESGIPDHVPLHICSTINGDDTVLEHCHELNGKAEEAILVTPNWIISHVKNMTAAATHGIFGLQGISVAKSPNWQKIHGPFISEALFWLEEGVHHMQSNDGTLTPEQLSADHQYFLSHPTAASRNYNKIHAEVAARKIIHPAEQEFERSLEIEAIRQRFLDRHR